MSRWTLKSEQAGRVDIEASAWTEAVAVAIQLHLPRLCGSRFVARVHRDGSVTFTRDGGEEHFELRPGSRHRGQRPDRTPDGVAIYDDCRYSGAQLELIVPFGVMADEDEDAPATAPHQRGAPPASFDRDIDAACARFAAAGGQRIGEISWGAIALWLSFIDAEAIGVCASDGEHDTWLARQGATRGLASGAGPAGIRALARATDTSWAVYSAATQHAAMVCPLPNHDAGDGAFDHAVLEAWTSGPAYADWQLEVGMLTATLLSERAAPATLRRAS